MNRLSRLSTAAAALLLGGTLTFAQQTTPTNPSQPGVPTNPVTPAPNPVAPSPAVPAGTPIDPTMPTTSPEPQKGAPDSTGQTDTNRSKKPGSKKKQTTPNTTPPK